MNNQTVITNNQKPTKSINNLTDHEVRKVLCKYMIGDRIDSLIQISKKSPIGIAADILTPIFLQYSRVTNTFSIFANN